MFDVLNIIFETELKAKGDESWIEGQIDGKTERCILNLHGYKQRKMIEILTLCWYQEITVEIPAL